MSDESHQARAKGAVNETIVWSPTISKWTWRAICSLIAGSLLLYFGLFNFADRKAVGYATWRILDQKWNHPLWEIILPSSSVVLLFVIISVIVIEFVDRRRKFQVDDISWQRDLLQEKLLSLTLQLNNAKDLLRDRERLRMTDHITGIQNFQSWEHDLKQWVSQDTLRRSFSLVLIDLDNLKWLNSHSRQCADLVLRYFARQTYESMRRNEQIYKLNPEMYRHYQGGDEFFFIVESTVYDAVGFVNRLKKQSIDHGRYIKSDILPNFLTLEQNEAFELAFCASIAPLDFSADAKSADPKMILENAFAVLDRAKDPATRSRLLITVDEERSYIDPLRRYTDPLDECRRLKELIRRKEDHMARVEFDDEDAKDEALEELRGRRSQIMLIEESIRLFSR